MRSVVDVVSLVQSHDECIEVFVAKLLGKLFGGYHIRNATNSNPKQRLIGDNCQDRNMHIAQREIIPKPVCRRLCLKRANLNAV